MTNQPGKQTRNDHDCAKALLSALEATDSVLLFSHLSPDGDTLGSTLALKLLLESAHKRTQMILDGEIPENLHFLPHGDAFLKPEAASVPPNALAVAVDVSCEERLGAAGALYRSAAQTAVIDHHRTNEGFGRINWIDGDAPATAILVYRLAEAMNLPISTEIAVCLYTALATDTGNFGYQATNAESFAMMAALMKAGLPLAEVSRALFRQKREAFVRLLGAALPSLRVAEGGRIAGLQVSLADIRKAGCNAADTDGVVNYAIDIKGVRMAYFAHENEAGEIKFSLRALSPYRVDGVAASFGGGGHQLAAGCALKAPLEQAAEIMEKALTEAWRAQQTGQ